MDASPGGAPAESRRPWLVAGTVAVSLLLGAVVAAIVVQTFAPSGLVQPSGTVPVSAELDTGTVWLLFGVPFAALASALVASYGLRRKQALPYSVGGIAVSIAVLTFVGLEAVTIGRWWITSVPSDTNQAAALFTAILAPWGILALLMATVGAGAIRFSGRGSGPFYFATCGVLLGLLLGSFVGVEASSITWALNCVPSSSCDFNLSGVIYTGGLVGGFLGMTLGGTVRPGGLAFPVP